MISEEHYALKKAEVKLLPEFSKRFFSFLQMPLKLSDYTHERNNLSDSNYH